MKKIVQCVPNFSEGINEDIIKQIVLPLQNKDGFLFVSYEPDKDYNRTVVTLIGDIESMIDPLVDFFVEAEKLINMNNHKGEHPRMGAIDVLPFIPISGITIKECVSYAEILSEKVNKKLNIPVFLYAEAAKNNQRKSLPNIRRGEFEGMKEKMLLPEWTPDYGKDFHETFGAVAIGARLPLIAYNIDLPTNDEKIAGSIARAIRGSSGGFKFVQAGPASLLDKGIVQVTMNILDYKKNPLYRVFEVVKMEAKRYGLDVASSEVIGLIPKDTLLRSIKYYLRAEGVEIKEDYSLEEVSSLAIKYFGLKDFDKDKIIESYLVEDINNES